MRDVFSELIIHYKKSIPEICVLDGDCSRSTKSGFFKKHYPADFYNVGIAEQNMVGIAAGLARCGFRPILSSFASILVCRACEQIIQSVCLPKLPVILVGHYSGVSASLEGAPHHAISDLGIVTSIPNLYVYTPSTKNDIEEAFLDSFTHKNPSYIRLSRNKPAIYSGLQEKHFKGYSLYGNFSNKILVITIGNMATEIFDLLNTEDSFYSSISILTLLQLTPDTYKKNIAEILSHFENIVILEDHYINGGLGTIVNSIVAEYKLRQKIYHLAISSFTETGDYNWLLNKIGIGKENLLKTLNFILNE